MKNYFTERTIGFIVLILFAAILIWAVFVIPQNPIAIFIAVIIVVIAIATFFFQVLEKKGDIEAGDPAKDEFTRLTRVYAGSRAFIYSMYLWMLIFVFNSAFPKPQSMLGVGILGSALIYGIWLLYFRTTGEMYEE